MTQAKKSDTSLDLHRMTVSKDTAKAYKSWKADCPKDGNSVMFMKMVEHCVNTDFNPRFGGADSEL